MAEIELANRGWRHGDSVHARGSAFDGAGSRADLIRCFQNVGTFSEFQQINRSLSGFYSVIVDCDTDYFLACDHARSIPLYFTTTSPLTIADTASRINTLDRENAFDSVSESEFLLTRYVTGGETVYPTLESVGAGEAVRLPATRPGGNERSRYFTYRPTSVDGDDRSAYLNRLRETFESALDRTISYLDDRPALVPLSGGLDSRLVATGLARRGIDVTAFTFGRRGHADVEVSREVADNLGIDWEWVEYTPDRWADWYDSDAYRGYCAWAFNYDSLPFLANWPAVKVLCEEDRIPEDAVVCPGHTVATPSERVPEAWPERESPQAAVIDHILDTHYNLWDWDDDRAHDIFESRIASQTDLNDLDSEGEMAAAYEQWEWATRMALFTHGDLRIYDWFDIDWWLPLCDPAYVEAWASISTGLRYGKQLQNELAREMYAATAHVDPEIAARTDTDWGAVDQLQRTAETNPIAFLESGFEEWFGAQSTPASEWERPGNHPLAWYGILPEPAQRTLAGAKNLYAIRTLLATGRCSLDQSDSTNERVPRRLELPIEDASGDFEGRL